MLPAALTRTAGSAATYRIIRAVNLRHGAALGVVVAMFAVESGSGARAPGSSARALAISIVTPSGVVAATPEAAAPPDGVQFSGGFAYPDDGSVVTTGAVTASASASADGSTAAASASSEISSVSLFGGELSIERVVARARADAGNGAARGSTSESAVVGMTVGGVPVEAVGQVLLGDWGVVTPLSSAEAPDEGAFRGSVTALEIRLSLEHGGLPAGSQILIGYAEAAAGSGAPPPVAPPLPDDTETTRTAPAPVATVPEPPRAQPKAGAKEPRPETEVAPALPPIVRGLPSGLSPELTKGGYVFPVYGRADFSDTFGAARATTGWHHGADIFAELGTPVLAVARGKLFSVGWNDVGGNRLWLRDTKGNEFYYAHMSAFSPLAVNGGMVDAGDVIGFVGNSGDADGTPFHLHFEIHPLGLLVLGYDGVINPTAPLAAWRRLLDVRFIGSGDPAQFLALTAEPSDAPSPGAYLLSSSDISDAPQLDRRSVARAFAHGHGRGG